MNKNFLALIFILMSSLAFSEPSESEDIPPPDEVYNYDPAVDEPEITIIEEEDQFIEEFLPQIVCTNANCEVVDKSGNIKGYITNKELQSSLTKS